jgi:hypothetical protein
MQGNKRNKSTISVGKHEGKTKFEHRGLDGGTMLKWIIRKWYGKPWIGFIWLRNGINFELL